MQGGGPADEQHHQGTISIERAHGKAYKTSQALVAETTPCLALRMCTFPPGSTRAKISISWCKAISDQVVPKHAGAGLFSSVRVQEQDCSQVCDRRSRTVLGCESQAHARRRMGLGMQLNVKSTCSSGQARSSRYIIFDATCHQNLLVGPPRQVVQPPRFVPAARS